LALGLFQSGCGGGGKAAGQVNESPESSMTSEVAGSDESASAEASADEVTAVDGDSASAEDIAGAGEEPAADTLLATEGMDTEKEEEAKAEDEAAVSSNSEEPESTVLVNAEGRGALATGGVETYTVVKGDCLWRIAEKSSIYQDPWEWPLLFHANEQLISNPDLIQVGWDLSVPRGVEEGKIVAAIQEARAAHYVPPSRASRVISTQAAPVAAASTKAAEAKPAVVTSAKPSSEAKPMAAKKTGGGLKGILWFLILAALGAAGYLYWKRVNSGKSLGMGTASF
jgi:LysM repeat protein